MHYTPYIQVDSRQQELTKAKNVKKQMLLRSIQRRKFSKFDIIIYEKLLLRYSCSKMFFTSDSLFRVLIMAIGIYIAIGIWYKSIVQWTIVQCSFIPFVIEKFQIFSQQIQNFRAH